MRFPIEHSMALLDGGLPECLRQMTRPAPRWPEEEEIFALRDEAARRELEDECPVHLLVEGEVERVEGARGIAEAGLRTAPFEESILAALQFIVDEHRQQIERRQPVGLRLSEAYVEDVGHAGESQLAERVIAFGEIHDVQDVVARRSIRSR